MRVRRPHTVTILRRSDDATDRYNDQTYIWTPDATTVKARIDIAAQGEEIGGQDRQELRVDMLFGPGVALKSGDRIRWEDRPDNPIYMIEGPPEIVSTHTTVDNHTEAKGLRITGG